MGVPSESLSPEDLRVLELLVLRHLYDGDVVDWPLPDEHPERGVFDDLEARGWIARWDRIWPLRDRYRLTDAGIAEIERWYRPDAAEAARARMGAVPADERRRWLEEQGYDADIWPALHDPYTHWSSFRYDRGPAHRWLWQAPSTPLRRSEGADRTSPRDAVEDLDLRSRTRASDALDPLLPFGDVS